jgi:hypothetical protein
MKPTRPTTPGKAPGPDRAVGLLASAFILAISRIQAETGADSIAVSKEDTGVEVRVSWSLPGPYGDTSYVAWYRAGYKADAAALVQRTIAAVLTARGLRAPAST